MLKAASVVAAADTARSDGWSRRLWAKDASLWTGRDEDRWLGWLAAGVWRAAVDIAALEAFQAEVQAARVSPTFCC